MQCKFQSDEASKKTNGFLPKEPTTSVVKPIITDDSKPLLSGDNKPTSSEVTIVPQHLPQSEASAQIKAQTETDLANNPEPKIPEEKLEGILSGVESDLNQSVAESFASIIGENPDRVLKKSFEFASEEEALIVPQSHPKAESERPNLAAATEHNHVEEPTSVIVDKVVDLTSEPSTVEKCSESQAVEKVDLESHCIENVALEPTKIENVKPETTEIEKTESKPTSIENVISEPTEAGKIQSEPTNVENVVPEPSEVEKTDPEPTNVPEPTKIEKEPMPVEKLVSESGDVEVETVSKSFQLSAESSRNDSGSFWTAESGNTEESSTESAKKSSSGSDADDEKTSRSMDLSSFEDLGSPLSLKIDANLFDAKRVVECFVEQTFHQHSDVDCGDEDTPEKSSNDSASGESSPGLRVTETEQVPFMPIALTNIVLN